MSLIQEVVDGIKVVTELVEGIRKIAATVRSGAAYLSNKHPEVRGEVIDLCDEIDKTLLALADASALVTRFRFTLTGPAVATEPTRFNDYLIANGVKEEVLTDRITRLRGRCDKVARATSALQASALRGGLRSLWGLFPQVSTLEVSLANTLQQLHNEEMLLYGLTRKFSAAIVTTLRMVDHELSGDPARVPVADARLREHAPVFAELTAGCRAASADFAAAIAQLV